MEREAIVEMLEADVSQGLTDQEVEARQAKYGLNTLEEEAKEPWLLKFFNQFKDFMVLILIIASIVSAFLGDWIEAIVIIAIVIINAILGVHQEGQAEQAVAALQKLSSVRTRVIRNGQQTVVNSEELVPGDLVLLEAGDVVPADIRLVESVTLKAEEASLTGESVPVEKDYLFEATPQTPLGDRANMVFNGTSVTYGRGRGIVTGTGEYTEIGRIADRLKGIKQEATPLQLNLNQLSKWLGIVCLVVCAIVFVVGVLRGGEVLDIFMTAVSLAVAAIPEGLTVVVTIVLSLGMKRMADRNAIVKKLLAVETLGSVNVICSDKTGTLTQNEMTVTRLYVAHKTYEVSGVGYSPLGDITPAGDTNTAADLSAPELRRLLEIGALCNDATLQKGEAGDYEMIGDPTEGAMLTVAAKAGITPSGLAEDRTQQGEMPFDSERKMMTVFYDGMDRDLLALTKGAPDVILSRCVAEMTADGEVPLTDDRRAEILTQNTDFARQALRVLAFAYSHHETVDTDAAEQNMVFVGLMGMIDPPRPEVRDSITLCHRAGIRT
ncbi:MAG TPA: HAD-IC family P-type ATPase, partial [Clostridiaceae bacterium]|nr:HAD-IC family P-type ATPase [Clostridiaceae bacterium]